MKVFLNCDDSPLEADNLALMLAVGCCHTFELSGVLTAGSTRTLLGSEPSIAPSFPFSVSLTRQQLTGPYLLGKVIAKLPDSAIFPHPTSLIFKDLLWIPELLMYQP